MPNAPVYSLNGGEVGDEGLARLDLERLQFSGSLYQNVLPRVIGSMTLRPGLEHIADIDLGEVMLLDYPYAGGSDFVPILSDEELRIVKDGSFVTRASVSTTITNGDFSSFTGWTDGSSGGASADVSGGQLRLLGTSQNEAIAQYSITISGGDQGTEHGLRIKIAKGPVNVRLGTTSGAKDVLDAMTLYDGDHSIAFTPNQGTLYLELTNSAPRRSLVDSCQIDSAGTLVLESPWTDTDLADNIVRYTKNKDVTYIASGVYQQREMQRRGDTSWGIQKYKVDDGPFYASDGDISLTPNVLVDNGSATLTANKNYFEDNMINRLFRIYHSGQVVEEDFSSDPAEGDYIRISGVGGDRRFYYTVEGTWTGTIRLQEALDDGSGTAPGSWSDLTTRTSNITSTGYKDDDNNVIKYYRFAVNSGDVVSGTIETLLEYDNGSGSGIARITAVNSATEADVEIVDRFSNSTASFDWDYSTWSDYDGWPAAVERFGGRLYWGQLDTLYGSVPDAYRSFDDNVEGDSAPINRAIGAGSSRGALWLMGLQRLLAGTDEAEYSIKSSGYDEPLTNDQWLPIEISTRGCASIRAVKTDQTGVFVQSSGTGVFGLSTEQGTIDYVSSDLLEMHEEICDGYDIVDIAVQRRPDTILWFILSNGEARALTFEPRQRVVAWSRVVTDGYFKRVCATRNSGNDSIHFAVERDGTLRLEKLADMTECRGASKNCLADGYSYFSVSSSQDTFSVPNLDGLDVTVWVNGVAIHDQDDLYTVSSSQVVLDTAVESGDVVIGLPYTADYQSTKLAYGARNGTALFQKKKVSKLGLYLVNTAVGKLLVGKDFDTLRPVSNVTATGAPLADGQVIAAFDADMKPVSSSWDTDSRICMRMKTPYPATVAAMVLGIDTNG
jgi:hypothetical protein